MHPRFRGWEWVFPILAIAFALALLKGFVQFVIDLMR